MKRQLFLSKYFPSSFILIQLCTSNNAQFVQVQRQRLFALVTVVLHCEVYVESSTASDKVYFVDSGSSSKYAVGPFERSMALIWLLSLSATMFVAAVEVS